MRNIVKGIILVLGIVLLAGNASAYTYAECMDDHGITDDSTFREKRAASSECQSVIEDNIAEMREKIEAITTATEIFKACMAEEDGNAIDCLKEADIIDVEAIIQEKIAEITAQIQQQIDAFKAEMAQRVEEAQACIMDIEFMSLEKEQRQAAVQECLSILTEE